MNKVVTAIISALMLSGCASTGVVPVDSGTFMIAKRSVQAGFGPPTAVKADVYREANAFCATKNSEVETVDLDMTNSGLGRPGNVSLTFRCVKTAAK